MGEAKGVPRGVSGTTLEGRDGLRNTLSVMAAGFGFSFVHLGGHIALAALPGLWAMPAAPLSLFIEYTYVLSWYFAFYCLQGGFETLHG